MSQDKKILLHYGLEYRRYAEVEIILRENEWSRNDSRWSNQQYDVLIDGEKVDTLTRDPSHVTHQVHGRIRYDNKPRVRFRANTHGLFYEDTRNEALGDILAGLGLTREKASVHLPGRSKWWRSCNLCEGEEG
jgi:hypothetical protein